MIWRWSMDGQYTSHSCYDTLFQGEIISASWEILGAAKGEVLYLACLDMAGLP
jgi:hypothetical protein